jgi:hypothetical protein
MSRIYISPDAHLEERGLGGIQTSVARGDNNINRRNQTNTSRSANLYYGQTKYNQNKWTC